MQNCKQIVSTLTTISGRRSICTTTPLEGKRNFRKFLVYNKRGTRVVKEAQRKNPLDCPVPIHKRGVRDTGIFVNGKYVEIPEKIPELIVPDLEGCKLRPYVSYKAPEVIQSEFTSLDLFNAIYSKKIIDDFKEGKLKEDLSPVEPSEHEKLDPEEALIRARKTGSDIF